MCDYLDIVRMPFGIASLCFFDADGFMSQASTSKTGHQVSRWTWWSFPVGNYIASCFQAVCVGSFFGIAMT